MDRQTNIVVNVGQIGHLDHNATTFIRKLTDRDVVVLEKRTPEVVSAIEYIAPIELPTLDVPVQKKEIPKWRSKGKRRKAYHQ